MLIVRQDWMDMKKMKNKKELGILLWLALMLIFILVVNGNLPANAENKELSKVAFYVT
jgi:hypothetical protein